MKLKLQDQHYLTIKSYLCDDDGELVYIEFIGHKSCVVNFEALYARDAIFIMQLDTYLKSSFDHVKKYSLGYDYVQIQLYNKEIFSHNFLIGQSEEELYEKFLIWLESKQVLPIPKGDITSKYVDYQHLLYEKMIAYGLLEPIEKYNLFAYFISDEVTNGCQEMQDLIVGTMTNLVVYDIKQICQKAENYNLAEDQIIVALRNTEQTVHIVSYEAHSKIYFALFENMQSGEKFWDEIDEKLFFNDEYEVLYTFEDKQRYIDEENIIQNLNPDTMVSSHDSIIFY